MKTTKVKTHLRNGKVVKAHTRTNKADKDMKDYLSSRSLKNPNWGKKKDGTIDYKKPPKKESTDWGAIEELKSFYRNKKSAKGCSHSKAVNLTREHANKKGLKFKVTDLK